MYLYMDEKEARVRENIYETWLYFFPNCKINGYISSFVTQAVSVKPDHLQNSTVKAPKSRPCHTDNPLKSIPCDK